MAGCGPDAAPPQAEAPAIATGSFAEHFRMTDSAILEQNDSALIVRISGIDVDAAGRILIGDVSEGNVKLFGRDGRLLRVIGRKGEGPGEFESPRYPRFGPGGLIYVADAQSGRIQAFDSAGEVRRFTRLADFSLITGFQPLADGSYLVLAEFAGDPHILSRVDSAGKVLRRYLPIAGVRPTGQGDHDLWRNVRNFSLDLSGDTAFVVSTISDSVWTVRLASGEESRSRLEIPGYVAPTVPSQVPPDVPALIKWANSFHAASTLSVDGGAVYLPYVQGVLNNGDPMLLLTRGRDGRWSALQGAPPVIGAANGRAITILNPGEAQVRLGFFQPRE